jgi:hypothetical protein
MVAWLMSAPEGGGSGILRRQHMASKKKWSPGCEFVIIKPILYPCS